MITGELVRRSPMRILERSMHGGLAPGAIGVIAGAKGLGKTACLVHIAIDQLMQDRHVIHVSFARDAGHIISWYEDIFAELSRRHHIDCVTDLHDHIIKNRVIMSFCQDDLPMARIERSIETLEAKGSFHADMVVIDGFDFSRTSVEEVGAIRAFARRRSNQVWMSASTAAGQDGMPRELAPFADEIAVVLRLEPAGSQVRLHLVKDRDLSAPAEIPHLELDSRTLLILET